MLGDSCSIYGEEYWSMIFRHQINLLFDLKYRYGGLISQTKLKRLIASESALVSFADHWVFGRILLSAVVLFYVHIRSRMCCGWTGEFAA